MRILRNRVLVKLIDEDTFSSGGLLIPKTANTMPTVKATVIQLGERSQYGEWWMKKGDIVNLDAPQWAKQEYHQYVHEGARCLFVNENDINFVV